MGKAKSKSGGFSAVEIVLVLVIVGLVGALGWTAYANYQKTAATSKTENAKSRQTSQKSDDTPSADPTTDWATYTGKDNKISFKYPKTWVTAEHPDLCSDNVVLFGPDASSVGICASDSMGQVSFRWQQTDQSCDSFGDDTAVTYDDGTVEEGSMNKTKEKVMVSGVSGYKRTSVSTGDGPWNTPKGTYVITYCFNTNGRMYVAQYSQLPSYPDARNDFNVVVTETLRFGN
jgi:Tfp pilus assembly protein PilE